MAQAASPVTRFIVGLWKTIDVIRKIIIWLFLLAIAAVIYFLVAGLPGPSVPQKAALIWTPHGKLVTQVSEGPRQLLRELSGEAPRRSSVHMLKTALERGARDKRIKMAVLDLSHMDHAGMAQLQTLRGAIKDFEASGKQVIAYAPSYDQKSYYLAAQADKVYMGPMGMVLMQGFSYYSPYLKDALDKLHVQVHVFRQGRYKSAVEPFMRNDMSPAAREEDSAWLGDLWGVYKAGAADARGLSPQALDHYANTLPQALQKADGDGAKLAVKDGLVDKLITTQRLRALVAKQVGKNSHGGFNQIDENVYVDATGGLYKNHGDHEIGLIVVDGPIVSGAGKAGTAGSDTISAELHRAGQDSHIKAVVVQVDSPGGSANASEQIRNAMIQLQQSGKPVVVSMADMGASGAYWLSMNADQIWARASTITGSIGIFGLFPTFNKGLAKLGIHTDGVGTNRYSGALNPTRKLNPEVGKAFQAVINNGYRRFTHDVAQARGMKVAQVNKIAQGRVWSGKAAKKRGLVDHLGGLNQALQAAAKLAHIKGQPVVRPLRRKSGLGAHLLQGAAGLAARVGVGDVLGLPHWLTRAIEQRPKRLDLSWMNDPRGVYAYCACHPDSGSGAAP